ncbi:MAG: 50S ribosomal protein L11 methyltransferase, partial [Ktedonobacteraceae bacterium]|nr:50S ribosomal protein L11 methyltransferase [Ktedonobacteraceae bacterium]
MLWLELTVQAHLEAVESVSELLNRYIPSGVAIEEPIELLGEGQGYRVLTGQSVSVHAYVPIDGKQEEVRQYIEEGLWHLTCLGEHFVSAMQTRVVDEQDWASAWKDYFHVTHIGQRLVIRPSWREYKPQLHEVVLTLDPGMAFGTGLHPTTRMCLEQI